MRSILTLATVAVALAASARDCVSSSTASEPSPAHNEVANATVLVDVVGRWTGPKPTPKSEFAWGDDGAFDMQVHESLTARLASVDIRVNGAFPARAIPERMGQWIDQSRRQGGTVRTCAVNEGARGILGHITLVVGAVQDVAAWQLYRPIKDYSVLVVVTPEDRRVRNVLLVRDNRTTGCPPGTESASS